MRFVLINEFSAKVKAETYFIDIMVILFVGELRSGWMLGVSSLSSLSEVDKLMLVLLYINQIIA